jgi:hypothetical protein
MAYSLLLVTSKASMVFTEHARGVKVAEHKRDIRNFVINKPFQLRIAYYFVALSLALIGLLMVFMNSYMGEIRIILANISGFPMQAQLDIENTLNHLVNTVYIFLFCSVAVTVLYAIIISHRIAGPMLAIRAFIKNIKEGRYEDKRSLRPYDELTPIMDELHELADILKSKR